MKGPAVPTALDFASVLYTHEGAILPFDQVASRLRELADQLEKTTGIQLFASGAYSFESKPTRPDDLAESYITFVLKLGKRAGPSEAEEKAAARLSAHRDKCQKCQKNLSCSTGLKLEKQYMKASSPNKN